jgi:hypothetical protein
LLYPILPPAIRFYDSFIDDIAVAEGVKGLKVSEKLKASEHLIRGLYQSTMQTGRVPSPNDRDGQHPHPYRVLISKERSGLLR